jgi:hypothetical protein
VALWHICVSCSARVRPADAQETLGGVLHQLLPVPSAAVLIVFKSRYKPPTEPLTHSRVMGTRT